MSGNLNCLVHSAGSVASVPLGAAFDWTELCCNHLNLMLTLVHALCERRVHTELVMSETTEAVFGCSDLWRAAFGWMRLFYLDTASNYPELPMGRAPEPSVLSAEDPDWLYVRTASMVRKIYIRKGMGVGRLAKNQCASLEIDGPLQ